MDEFDSVIGSKFKQGGVIEGIAVKDLGEVGNWYRIHQIDPNLFWIHEPGHVSFFIYKFQDRALFIDSGLGFSDRLAEQLLSYLGIATFDVICTHAHCDHIGLNYRARKIYISPQEWEKYKSQNENEQILHYHEMLKTLKPWPVEYQGQQTTREWSPTDFIQDNSEIDFENIKLIAVGCQGHTVGSLMFLDLSAGYLFTGDLIYTGTMYLHLKDSDYECFKKSLEKILELQNQIPELQIWPCHNQIPLPKEFPSTVQEFLSNYEAGNPEIQETVDERNAIFERGVNLKSGSVSVTVKKSTFDRKK